MTLRPPCRQFFKNLSTCQRDTPLLLGVLAKTYGFNLEKMCRLKIPTARGFDLEVIRSHFFKTNPIVNVPKNFF